MMRLARFGGAATSITKLGKAFSVLKNFALTAGKILSGAFVKAITMAGKAFMWLGRALLTNPIGLAITAIALGAYLIYQY
ncbi:hypothetical protein [Canicola haemoglobinophilus]|nr:hypothetical protein [Canicola haemoglobinophilus]